MQEIYTLSSERSRGGTWGIPFWGGTFLSLLVLSYFMQTAIFTEVSIKTFLGSILFALAPAILAGVFLQVVWSLIKGTAAGDFGLSAYLMIIASTAIMIAVGLLFSRLPDHWQNRIGILLEVFIFMMLLLTAGVQITKKRKAR